MSDEQEKSLLAKTLENIRAEWEAPLKARIAELEKELQEKKDELDRVYSRANEGISIGEQLMEQLDEERDTSAQWKKRADEALELLQKVANSPRSVLQMAKEAEAERDRLYRRHEILVQRLATVAGVKVDIQRAVDLLQKNLDTLKPLFGPIPDLPTADELGSFYVSPNVEVVRKGVKPQEEPSNGEQEERPEGRSEGNKDS